MITTTVPSIRLSIQAKSKMGVCGSRRARDNVLLLCICAGAFGGTVRDVARANTIMCAIFDNTTAIAPDVTQL